MSLSTTYTKAETDYLIQQLEIKTSSGYQGDLLKTDAAPTTKGFYALLETGVYTNLGGIDAQSGKLNFASFDGTTWSKVEVALPEGKTIETWSAKSFVSGSQVFYNGKIYEAIGAAVAGDVPGTASVWVLRFEASVEPLEYFNSLPDGNGVGEQIVDFASATANLLLANGTTSASASNRVLLNVLTNNFSKIKITLSLPYISTFTNIPMSLLGWRKSDNVIESVLHGLNNTTSTKLISNIILDISEYSKLAIGYNSSTTPDVRLFNENIDLKTNSVKKYIDDIAEVVLDYDYSEYDDVLFSLQGVYWSALNNTIQASTDVSTTASTPFIQLEKGDKIVAKIQSNNVANFGIVTNISGVFTKASDTEFIATEKCVAFVSTLKQTQHVDGVDYWVKHYKETKVLKSAGSTSETKAQLQKDVNRSLKLKPTDVISYKAIDRGFKATEEGYYGNLILSNSSTQKSVETFQDGVSVGQRIPEVSSFDLEKFDVYFIYSVADDKWEKRVFDKVSENSKYVSKLVGNGCWCWFGKPNGITLANGVDIISYVQNAGRVQALQLNTDGTFVSLPLSSWTQIDDHNQSSILELSDGKILFVYQKHGSENKFYVRKTNSVGTLADGLTTELVVTNNTADNVTYSYLFQIADGTIINIFRNGSNSGVLMSWKAFKSTDGGTTWSVDREVFTTNGGYLIARQDDLNKNIIHCITTNKHPNRNSYEVTNVYYFKADFSNGNAYKADGTLISAMPTGANATSGVDIITNKLSGVYWIEDVIAWNGLPRLLYVDYPNVTAVNGLSKHLCYKEFNGTSWSNEMIISKYLEGYSDTDGTVAETLYSCGAVFDRANRNSIITPIQVNGVMEIFRVNISSELLFEQMTFNSADDQWRPITTNTGAIYYINKATYINYDNFSTQVMQLK